ncbi:MAG: flagellar hook-length control protein FliK [Thiotrichaceae bacterium]|nr:flagellar hook-length control protein FliK [Thiotrichaceae bacterium]
MSNLASGLSAVDSASQAENGLNSAINSASGGNQASSPLFSNLLASAAQSEQAQFQAHGMNAFESQTLPLERQLLPHSIRLTPNLAGQSDAAAQQLLMDEGALLHGFDVSKQVFVTPTVVAENMIRPQELAAQMVAQMGQGQAKLQQDLMMRQLAAAPLETTDGDLAGSRLVPTLENSAVVGAGAQLSNMLRDSMLLKQQYSGGESKVGDSFSSALGNLTTLAGDAKGSGEAKPLMQASINTPFSQQAGWGEEVGSRIKWMVNSQVQSAELKMNPANLGPIEVKISVQNDQTTIHFSAQNSVVREALDAAMPRLREMLGDNGVNLADVEVSDQSFAQQQKAFEQANDAMGDEYASGDELDGEDAIESDEGEMLLSSKIVDYYA